jgi:methylmalonyl-CoA mutase cobalamin-binding domain/chain
MGSYEALKEAVIKGRMDEAVAEAEQALAGGEGVAAIIDQGLIAAMDVVGERFAGGQVFVPQMLRSAKVMQRCMELLKPRFRAGEATSRGTVVIGTVQGDLHDIGKNLVAMMMEGAGFAIVDLGVDVTPERFVEAAREEKADIVAMSALLSTTMPAMKKTIGALAGAGLGESVRVMVGGAPVTGAYAAEIGAHAYAPEAGTAVARARELLGVA